MCHTNQLNIDSEVVNFPKIQSISKIYDKIVVEFYV